MLACEGIPNDCIRGSVLNGVIETNRLSRKGMLMEQGRDAEEVLIGFG